MYIGDAVQSVATERRLSMTAWSHIVEGGPATERLRRRTTRKRACRSSQGQSRQLTTRKGSVRGLAAAERPLWRGRRGTL